MFQDRAAQVNPSSTKSPSPVKAPVKAVSPKKASAAMKSVQETLVNKTHSTDMAQRLRDERMAELKGIQNRWKNGILKDDGEEEEEKKV